MLEFELENLADGASVPVEVYVHPANSDINGYLKFNHQGQFWYNIAEAIDTVNGATRIRFTLEDGGPYDDDPDAGEIKDPGGPFILRSSSSAQPIPTLQRWGLIALILSLGLGLTVLRRRKRLIHH